MSSRMRVLFLCTGNSCRSQMAEGFLRHLAGDKFEAFSAGVKPARVNPLAVRVMAEEGIDISGQRPKPAADLISQKFDYVITVCDNAKQACPVFPGRHEKIHWNLQDPAEAEGTDEEKLEVFRKSRGEIRGKVTGFIILAALRQGSKKAPA